MPDWAVELIQKDPETFIRVCAIIIAAIGANGIWQVLKRRDKDAEIIRQSLEREQVRADEERERLDELQEDITEQTKERWLLMERLARAEAESENCREMLSRSGLGGLNAAEEKTLRDMVTTLKAENVRKDAVIQRQDALIRKLQSNRTEGDYREE